MRTLDLAILLLLAAGCSVVGRTPVDLLTASIVEATTPSAEIPTWLADTYLELHERYRARARCDDAGVVFLGDSLVHGWREAGAEIWEEHFAPMDALNFGIPGDRSQWLLWRLRDGEIENLQPRAYVVMIGTNNLKSGPDRMPPSAAASGAWAVVDLLHRWRPGTPVFLMGILPRQPEYPWMDAAVRRTNEELRARARRDPLVDFVDLAPAFRDDGGLARDCYAEDLLHLRAEGYRRWAEVLASRLAALKEEEGSGDPP